MPFQLDKPPWPDEDSRFEAIAEIVRSANGDVLLELLDEYKRIAILELPDAVRDRTSGTVAERLVARIDFIDEFVTLLRETTTKNEPENDDGG